MRILKIIGMILIALIGIFLILGAVSRKDFDTSQSIIIDAPQKQVFDVVNDLSTWDSWSPWKEQDPTIKSTMGDPHIGKGGNYSWTSEKMGDGSLVISESNSPSLIENKLDFGSQGKADAKFTFEPADKGTKVTWHFHTHTAFPMNAMMVLMGMEKMMDKSYSRGLELLKTKVEAMPKKPALSVKTVEYPGQTFVMKRDKVSMNEVSAFYQKNLPALFGSCEKAKLKMTDMPSGLYYSWDMSNNIADMAAAIPVSDAKAVPKGMEMGITNAGKALQVDYYGDYSGISTAHDAMEAYMAANNLERTWPVIETYVTDPTTEPDPNKWLTKVIYPLQ